MTPILATEARAADSFIPADILTWAERGAHFNSRSRTEYETLLQQMVIMGQQKINLDIYGRNFFDPGAMTVHFCSEEGEPNMSFPTNVRTAWTYLYIMQSMLMSVPNVSDWFTRSEPQCVLVQSLPGLPDGFTAIRPTLTLISDDLLDAGRTLFESMRYWLPLVVFAFCTVTWLVVSILYVREVNIFMALLLDLPKNVRRECTRPIRRDAHDGDLITTRVTTNPTHLSVPILFNSAIFFVVVTECALVCLQAENLKSTNDIYRYLTAWIIASRSRKANVLEGAIGALLAVLRDNPLTRHPSGHDYITEDGVKILTDGCNAALMTSNAALLDSGELPSSIGWNDEIDHLTISARN
jgi:hypothetical protein